LPVYIPAVTGEQDESEEIHVQVILSERSLNSMLWELHHNNETEVEWTMSSTLVKTFFWNFEEVFGHTDSLNVKLQSTVAPTVIIDDGLSKVTTKA